VAGDEKRRGDGEAAAEASFCSALIRYGLSHSTNTADQQAAAIGAFSNAQAGRLLIRLCIDKAHWSIVIARLRSLCLTSTRRLLTVSQRIRDSALISERRAAAFEADSPLRPSLRRPAYWNI
jgi:hypothetical protein